MNLASPKLEVFAFYNSSNVPLAGLSVSFAAYRDSSGAVVASPAVSEMGDGLYKFTPVFSDVTKGIGYIADGGSTAYPRYYSRYMRPEDWNTDSVDSLVSTATTASLAAVATSSFAVFSASLAAVNAANATFSASLAVTNSANAVYSSSIAAYSSSIAASASVGARKFLYGKAEIFSTGSNAYREVRYDPAGGSIVAMFDLKDQNGSASVGPIIFQKIPIP